MQSTSNTTGSNRTGAAASPDSTEAMVDAVRLYCPPSAIDTSESERDHAEYVKLADAIGSVPPPASLKGALKSGIDKLMGDEPALLMDKIGERIAFERGGTRLYDALIMKYKATLAEGEHLPTVAEAATINGEDASLMKSFRGEEALETLERIREEELAHFDLLCNAMRQLGGDPTAMTPCADVVATASAGLIQVVTDPRTTIAQSLNAMLTAELTDNAGWELLIQLTERMGKDELTGAFLSAHAQEAQHLVAVRQWLMALVATETTSALV